jgi:hypothetical protein
LGIWDVTALSQEAEPDDIARRSCGDDARANVVADIAAPTDERLLLSDAHPLAGDFVEPDVLRKIGKALAQSAKFAVVVAID